MPTYALTTATHQRRALFMRRANAELLMQILFHYRDQGRFLLHGFAIMPDHLHVLLTPSRDQTVERCAQCIKGGFSFQVRQSFKGEIWQTGFHEHRIRDEEDFRNQLAYVAANPERRGLREYEFVHTRHLDRIDSMPAGLAPEYLRG
ncbi:REP-associated tyrosine transposase [Occallatibacter riparius]|uniref:Transposase n=1 Tax=Occallatibacter riparius TaxID=1002689 RepID=A0A9J7BRX8_9BACT|nr:transposase [Occallatibacter riparius]UWZ85644.1 transposase [Occallatibacter riparius]